MSQPIDIRPDHLQIVQDILNAHIPNHIVWVFGSRAKWTTKDASDLDLCVKGNELLSFETLGRLRDDFSESNLPYKVDVVDWYDLSESFRKIIEKEKICLPLKSRWKLMPISDVAEIMGGGTPKTDHPEYWDGKIPWLSVVDFNNDARWVYAAEKNITQKGLEASSTKILKKGQLIISARGTVGALAQLGNDMAFNQSCYGLNAHQSILTNDYLYYALKNVIKDIKRNAHGAIFDTITRDTFKHINIPVPSLNEQKNIVAMLEILDKKIELNHQMNKTLEAIARALFKSWFVDFDPVRAKMEGRQPEGLSSDLSALFPKVFIDSSLGQIPKGWVIKSVGDLVKIVKGRSYTSSELERSETALVTLKSFFRGGGYRKDGLKSFLGTFKPEQEIKPGDLVVAFTDVTQQAEIIGKPAIVSQTKEFKQLVASLDVGIIRPLKNSHALFYYFLFLSSNFQSHVYGHTSGTTVLHLSKEGIPSYKFAYPAEEYIVDQFSHIVHCLYEKISINEEQVVELSGLRDSLLPKLISGALRIENFQEVKNG